jgi:hypothetical protein
MSMRCALPRLRVVSALTAALVVSCKQSDTVTGPAVTAVTITPATLTLFGVGKSGIVAVAVTDGSGAVSNPSVAWTSRNTGVAMVSGNGSSATITSVGAGTVRIVASSGGKADSVAVTVSLGAALTIAGSGDGNGTVTSLPAGIACTVTAGVTSGTCTGTFAGNVTLTGAPVTGQAFAGWTGATCTGTGTCVVTMDQARTITATFANPCATVIPYTIGATVSGAITAASCPNSGTVISQYSYTVAAQSTLAFRVTSPTYPAFVAAIANDPTNWWYDAAAAAGAAITTNAIVAPGAYKIFVGSNSQGLFGAFTLSTTVDPALSCFDGVTVTPGITHVSALSGTCDNLVNPLGNVGSFPYYPYYLVSGAGRTLTVHVTSTAFNPVIYFLDGDFALLRTTATDAVGPTANLSFATATAQSMIVLVSSRTANAAGAYTVTIDPLTSQAFTLQSGLPAPPSAFGALRRFHIPGFRDR